jgi:hypothetical protein
MKKILLVMCALVAASAQARGADSSGGGYVSRGSDELLDEAIRITHNWILRDKNFAPKRFPPEHCVNQILKSEGKAMVSYAKMKELLSDVNKEYDTTRSVEILDSRGKKVKMPLFMDYRNGTLDVLFPFYVRYLGVEVDKGIGNHINDANVKQVVLMLLHELAHFFGYSNDNDAEAVGELIYEFGATADTTDTRWEENCGLK